MLFNERASWKFIIRISYLLLRFFYVDCSGMWDLEKANKVKAGSDWDLCMCKNLCLSSRWIWNRCCSLNLLPTINDLVWATNLRDSQVCTAAKILHCWSELVSHGALLQITAHPGFINYLFFLMYNFCAKLHALFHCLNCCVWNHN